MSLTRLVPKQNPDVKISRLWLVFFCEADGAPWWARFLPAGYRHVVACAWFDDQQRWVYYNPSRRGTVILLYREDEFVPRLTQLLSNSSCVVRIASRHERGATPLGWWCTGAIKALLGIKCRALSPLALCRHLLRNGGVAVDLAAHRSADVEPIQPRSTATTSARGLGPATAGAVPG